MSAGLSWLKGTQGITVWTGILGTSRFESGVWLNGI